MVVVVSDSGEPELLRIQEDGTLTLPLLGTTVAAGKTFAELRKELETKYPQLRRRHRHDDLIYEVRGEVKSPGPRLYVRGLSVSQAIQAAGGFTERAKSNQVRLARADSKGISVKLDESHPEPLVLPGDSIFVSRRLFVR